MAGLVMFSSLGTVSGLILCGPRVYYSMARDGLLFHWAGAIHPRFGTPHRAIVLQAVCSSVLVATGTYRSLFTRVVYTEWIFFALMAAGLLVLRRRAGLAGEYHIRGSALLAAVFIVFSSAIVVNQIIASPLESLFGLLLVLLGLPVYYWTVRRNRR